MALSPSQWPAPFPGCLPEGGSQTHSARGLSPHQTQAHPSGALAASASAAPRLEQHHTAEPSKVAGIPHPAPEVPNDRCSAQGFHPSLWPTTLGTRSESTVDPKLWVCLNLKHHLAPQRSP